MANQDYIGRAIEYPIKAANGSVRITTGNEVIENSLRRIWGVQVGELPANPAFGSKLYTVLFEKNNQVAISLCKTYMKESDAIWERRAQVLSVDGDVSDSDNSVLLLDITYRVTATNEIGSFVFPFYRQLEF